MRTKLAFAGGALAVTASVTAVVTGIATAPVGGPFTPAATAGELTPFEDCDELLAWYVEQALPDVGPWGLDGGYAPWERLTVTDVDGPQPEAARAQADASSEQAATSSDTGTNVQEAGVDEPDRAKTDGDVVVHLRERTLVVTDVSGSEPREVGTLELPEDVGSPELLLSGETVLVLSAPESFRPMPVDVVGERFMDRAIPGWAVEERSRLLQVSIADPSSPALVSDRNFGGALASARAYGDTVRLVLRTERPTLDFVRPDRNRTPEEARRLNEQVVRDSDISDWLPSVREGDGETQPLVGCGDVRHPEEGAGYGTVTVATMPASDPAALTTTAVTASGDTVYSSADRLYLAVPGDEWRSTDVHAFALDGTTTAYVASGTVDGDLRDRWAMDEHDGVLRLAVAHTDESWSAQDNGITTLRERGGDLEVAGSVRGLGPTEEIKSVRWFDDLAVVVTFRQTDPLYTVDLSDPAAPRTLGKLKIPGFSEYLHPVGDDRLLGFGHDASWQGVLRGGQVSLFDISDLAAPERVDTLALGRDIRPVAGWDPRALTWLAGGSPGTGTALTAVTDDRDGRSWLVEVHVTGGSLTEERRWALPRWEAELGRALPLDGDRVAVVGSSVEVVDVG